LLQQVLTDGGRKTLLEKSVGERLDQQGLADVSPRSLEYNPSCIVLNALQFLNGAL